MHQLNTSDGHFMGGQGAQSGNWLRRGGSQLTLEDMCLLLHIVFWDFTISFKVPGFANISL